MLARPEDIDERDLERSLGKVMVAHLGPASRPDAEMFTSLFRLVSDHGLRVPPEIAAVFWSMATLAGTLLQLTPGFAVLDETRNCARRLLGEQLEPAPLGEAGPTS